MLADLAAIIHTRFSI